MFKNYLQEIVNELAFKHSLFKDRGFIKNTTVVGGFTGITNEYVNYFFAEVDRLEIEKYRFEQSEIDSYSSFNIEFDFQLIFQTKCAIDGFLEVMCLDLSKMTDVKVKSATDDTELIYVYETKNELQEDGFQLYMIQCSFSRLVDLGSYVNCLEKTCFDADCCK